MKRRPYLAISAAFCILALTNGCVPDQFSAAGGGDATTGTGGTASEGGSDATPSSGNGGDAASGGLSAGGNDQSGGAGGAGGEGGPGTGGGTTFDEVWTLNEVFEVQKLGIQVPAGATTTECVYCPGPEHPVPMAGGFHLVNSTLVVQASYPENWDQPANWTSSNEWQRAGWCATVHNTDITTRIWELYMTCRDTSSVNVPALHLTTENVTVQWGGQGVLEIANKCPADHPIPWAAGFSEILGTPTSKVQLLASRPVGWSTEGLKQGAGWEVKVRGFNGGLGAGDHKVSTTLVCGTDGESLGHLKVGDSVETYAASAALPGNWAWVECPPERPIPIFGGAQSTSTATVVTGSRPFEWPHAQDWKGNEAAVWIASADNYDQNQQWIKATLVCRAPRMNETLP